MSKKKAFTGSTMTLKDFHGGSIPSDLPLPSAPGVIVRSSERSGVYDRPSTFGGPVGVRPDHHRARPHSSPSTRHLYDKTPFLGHPSHIGRHFDEDERKPLDGASALRHTVNDETFRSFASNKVELKPEPVANARMLGGFASSHSARVSEGSHGVGSHNVGGNPGQGGGSHSNVWAARKEITTSVHEPEQSALAGASAFSKLAHASALEKVSSGRWQTKHSTQYQSDVDVIEHLEKDKDVGYRGNGSYAYDKMSDGGGGEHPDARLARHLERSLAVENEIQRGRKEYERTRTTSYSELREQNPFVKSDRVQPQGIDVRFSGSELQSPVQSEPSEWPKVKLLPRTKPLENMEAPIVYHKQGYQQLGNSSSDHFERSEPHGLVNAEKYGFAGESEDQVVGRPKLNLKPRSQFLEQSEETIERERDALFGGARPREMVLKARGMDGSPGSNNDLVQHPDRVRHNGSRVERVPENLGPTRNGERTEIMPLDQRTGRKFERKDQRADAERVDKQRRNWRNESWRNSKETERQQQPQAQLVQDRPPSPETWRKPVEQPKLASSDGTGQRYGKTASALELAQAFSKSLSDPKPADRFVGQKSQPGKTQVPFSRLVNSVPRPQINDY